MSIYAPDRWVVIKINRNNPHYRVLAAWGGGYTTGDSWKLNSGITSVTVSGNVLEFHGSSKSVYNCHKESYGFMGISLGIWNQLKNDYGDKVELLDEDTDWASVDWIIS
jgi:hypothetical protein